MSNDTLTNAEKLSAAATNILSELARTGFSSEVCNEILAVVGGEIERQLRNQPVAENKFEFETDPKKVWRYNHVFGQVLRATKDHH